MGMRETVGSMRAYFILSGLLALLMNVGLLARSHGNPLLLLIGILLPKLVSSNSQLVPRVLVGTAVYLGLYLLLGLSLGQVGIGVVVQALLGLLITCYLFRNYKRLARETTGQPVA